MKSLLFVIPTMRMGGAERSLVSLLNALDPARDQVDLLLFEGGGILQSQLRFNARRCELPSEKADPVSELFGTLPAFRGQLQISVRFGPDELLLAQLPDRDAYGRLGNAQIVCHVHRPDAQIFFL